MMTVNLTCPACGATNRVPRERLQDNPSCGSCHEALFVGKPTDLDQTSFEKMQEHNETPLLVDYWAPWCGPCQQMAGDYAEAAAELEPGIRVAKVNTEDHQALSAAANIRGIPTLILYVGGKEVARHTGAQNKAGIVRWVETSLGTA